MKHREQDINWEDGKDFISLSRFNEYPKPGSRRFKLPWRLWSAVLFFFLVYLSVQGWIPLAAHWRDLLVQHLTSPAADWTPRIAKYFSMDNFEHQNYALGIQGEGMIGLPSASDAPVLAPATQPEKGQQSVALTPEPGSRPDAFVRPVEGGILHPFGSAASPVDCGQVFHAGVDLKTVPGQPVRAALPGRLLKVAREGNVFTVRLGHDAGLVTCYSGLAMVKVGPGREIKSGEELGSCAGEWLHFSVEQDGHPLDPTEWF